MLRETAAIALGMILTAIFVGFVLYVLPVLGLAVVYGLAS